MASTEGDGVAVPSLLAPRALSPTRPSDFAGWRMVVIALLSQTCAVGMTYGLYGTITSAIQTEFQTSRTLASSGMSVLLLGQALSAPFIGDLLHRMSVRSI